MCGEPHWLTVEQDVLDTTRQAGDILSGAFPRVSERVYCSAWLSRIEQWSTFRVVFAALRSQSRRTWPLRRQMIRYMAWALTGNCYAPELLDSPRAVQ